MSRETLSRASDGNKAARSVRTSASMLLVLAASFVPGIAPAAQAQSLEWIRQFGGVGSSTANGVSAYAGGIYVAGYYDPGGWQAAYLRKFDSSGTMVWARTFGIPLASATDVFAHSSGVYLVGFVVDALPGQVASGGGDVFVRKYDSEGNELWTRQFGSSGADSAVGVTGDSSGIYVVGSTSATLPGQASSGWIDAFVRKYDHSGAELWTRQFGTAGLDVAAAVAADPSGVCIVGTTDGTMPGQVSTGGGDAFLRKYDTNGSALWTRQFGSPVFDFVTGVSADSSGVYVGGQTNGALPGQTSAGDADAFVRKYDHSGVEAWTRQFGGAGFDYVGNVVADASGLHVTGAVTGALPGQTSAGDEDIFLRKYDANGTESWTFQFGTSGIDGTEALFVDGSVVYIAGQTFGVFPGETKQGSVDSFVAKVQVAPPPPAELILQLIQQVVALNLKQGIANSFDAKLQAAFDALDDLNENNNAAAINALQAFINAVEAQRGVSMSAADADALIAAARQIVAALGG